MKFLTAVLVFAISAVLVKSLDPAEKKKMLLQIVDSCKSSTNANDDDVAKMMVHAPNLSHEAKCMFSCIMTKLELINEGKVIHEHIKMWIQDMGGSIEQAEALIKECAGLTDPDVCVQTMKIADCVKDTAAKHNIVIDL